MKNLHREFADVNLQTVSVTKSLPAIKAIVKDRRLTQKAKTVFLGIYAFTGKDNSKAWPSVKALCDVLSMSHHTVNAALQELEQLEYLVCHNFAGKKVFYLKKTVVIKVQVAQSPWNAKPENPVEHDQATLGNKANADGSRTTDIGCTANKGCKQRFTNKDEKKKVLNSPPPLASLENHFTSLSERQKPILLDQIRKSALKSRLKHKVDGCWENENERKRFVMLRDFHRKAEESLCGVAYSDWG